MNLQEWVSSPRFMRLAMALARRTPEASGHRLAWWLAGTVAWFKPAPLRVLRANLRQVLGAEADERTLDRTAREALCVTIRNYYDLYRALGLSHEDLVAQVEVPEASRAVARSLWDRENGKVLVFPHLSSFDLGGHALAAIAPEMQLLTLPNPPLGFQLANELRRQSGVAITPLDPAALRRAIQLLRRGGVLAVAGDRPVSELDEAVPFFGRPARVPSGPVRLALKTGAALAMVYCVLAPETGRYRLHIEPPLELVHSRDRDEEVQINQRRVLDELERIIRRWAPQWQMYVPVWPDLPGVRA